MRDRPSRRARSVARTLFLSVLASALAAAGAAPAYAADDTEPPSTPGPVTLVEATTTSVALTWAPSTDNVGVVRYQVAMLYEDLGQGYLTDTNSIRIDGLRASHTYRFSVGAVDAAGNRSRYTTPDLRVTLPPGDVVPPSTPGQPVASEITQTSVRLMWARSTDNVILRGYELLRITDSATTVVGTTDGYPTPRYDKTLSGLTPGTTYTFAVRALDDAGNYSAVSEPVTVTTLPPPPSCAASHAVSQRPGVIMAQVTVRNTGSTAVSGWTMSWRLLASQQLRSLRGAVLVGRGDDTITVRDAGYNATIQPGGAVTISYVASGTTGPADVALNGGTCALAP